MKKLLKLLSVPSLSTTSKPAFKLLSVSAALFTIAVLLVLFRTARVSAGSEFDHDHDPDDIKARIGLEIAPVPLNFEHRDRRLVGLGSYIVNAKADCNGCHSQGPANEYIGAGNPYLLSPPKGPYTGMQEVNPATYLGGGRDFGPFGSKGELTHLYSRNLTPDKTGRPAGGHTFQEFLTILRTGKDYDLVHPNCTGAPDGNCLLPPFNGAVLQVMPWPVHQHMTDEDIRAIYEYLSAIPCIDTDIAGAPVLRNDCK
ncbi:MAG TPA: hypothetical protein VMT38_03360 [Terracidiphilus sp.]|nr:hypothetical protein [Terracidiphilus sp.]